MQNPPLQTLSRATLLFPLALVLLEFTVFIGNDLVQPAMLAITADFGVSSDWAASSMSFYLLGGASVAWLLGPLSDRLGRKKVLLAGVLFFALFCLLILLTTNIQSYLVLRFLQGIGLTVVAAVGYAAIQENFNERDAIKIMAIMANMSLIAPLIGPVLGSFMIEHISWHWGFVSIASLALLSWIGLKISMPEHAPSAKGQPYSNIFNEFKTIFSNTQFLGLAFSLPLLILPIMLWIALSPIMLVEHMGLTGMQYGLAQFPVLGGLILGNIVLVKIVDNYSLGRTVFVGLPLMLTGTLIVLVGVLWPSYALECLLIGMALVGFGEGISFSVIYRFALMSSKASHGAAAASVAMVIMFSVFFILELARLLYSQYQLTAYALLCFSLVACWFILPRLSLKKVMKQRLTDGQF